MNAKTASTIAAVLWISALVMGALGLTVPSLRILWLGAWSDGLLAAIFTFIAARRWTNGR